MTSSKDKDVLLEIQEAIQLCDEYDRELEKRIAFWDGLLMGLRL